MQTADKTSVSYGAALTFETLAEGEPAGTRMCADERTLLRVLDGIVRLTIEGSEQLLGIGDEAIIPAGSSHTIASASGEARIVIG
jgi:mannose-6-phosphate isomerase-like protein (cupin superfamily)